MRRRWLFLIAVAVVCVALWVGRSVWLTAFGATLVESVEPRPAPAVLVLAGDDTGQRLLSACELQTRGLAPLVLVSGPGNWYGINEADAAISFVSKKGCNASRLKALYIKAFSTVEEARAVRPILKGLGIRELIIVTSNYHTARAARVFRREFGNDLRFTMVAAPYEHFSPGEWWKTREGQKTAFYEFSKTIANWIGL